MKRWLSITFAISSFIGVLSVSVFAFAQTQFGSLNVPSSPVTKPTNTTKLTSSNGSYSEAVQFFKEKGITLSVEPPVQLPWASWGTFSQSDANVKTAAAYLRAEFSKYSAEQLKSSELKSIYLVKELVVSGQPRSGMPDPEVTDALYFDVTSLYLQSENGNYLKRTYHHEFNHFIIHKFSASYRPKDEAWSSCNADGSAYGNGGASMYSDPSFAHKAHPKHGFIDGYATSGIEEDKAEMFAYQMTDPSYVKSLASKDAGIACKQKLTENLLGSL